MTSHPITSWQINGGKKWTERQILFSLARKITEDSDWSHEIKRFLLLGRKAMTYIDSILKSKDVTLLTKVHIVNATVFPIVMYGYEIWTTKNAEHLRADVFEQWCWRRLLRVPWTARRSNQPILKKINLEYSLVGLMLKLKLQYFEVLTLWKTPWCWERLRAGGDEGNRGWDGCVTSRTQWTWIWANSGR